MYVFQKPFFSRLANSSQNTYRLLDSFCSTLSQRHLSLVLADKIQHSCLILNGTLQFIVTRVPKLFDSLPEGHLNFIFRQLLPRSECAIDFFFSEGRTNRSLFRRLANFKHGVANFHLLKQFNTITTLRYFARFHSEC